MDVGVDQPGNAGVKDPGVAEGDGSADELDLAGKLVGCSSVPCLFSSSFPSSASDARVISGVVSRGSWLLASSMSSSIQLSSTRVGGRIVAQGADAEDRLVLGLVGSPVFDVGVVVCAAGRVVNDHGEGGLNAEDAGCWRKPAGPLNCMLACFQDHALQSKAKGCRRNESRTCA